MAILVVAAGGLLGCQSTPTGSSPAGPTGNASGPSGPSTPGPSPAEALAAALAPLAAASEFDSVVTVDGVVATTLTGRTVDSATELSVTSSGRTVEYLRIPPNAWARETGAAWVIVDSTQAPSSPLAALAAPLTVEPAAGGVAATLQATYAAAALGLEGDPVAVLVTIEGSVVTFRYEQKSSGRAVVSTTVLRPATNTTPIATPAI
jgi:hypothetical protein